MYRIFQEGQSFGQLSGEAGTVEDSIEMAKKFSRERNGANFIVEKVEKVWEVKPRKASRSNAIHATIHADDMTGQDAD